MANIKQPYIFRVTVNDTLPFVYYCSQNDHQHCAAGMAGVVNADEKALEAYRCAA